MKIYASRLPLVLVILFAVLCWQARNPSAQTTDEAALLKRAQKLHREAIVIDTHNDVTSELLDNGFDLADNGVKADGTLRTHTDIKRLRAGGLDAQFFAVYVDKDLINKTAAQGGGAARRTLDMIGVVYEQVARHPETFEMAFTAADVRRIVKRGKLASLMGIEGGHAIEDSLYALRMYHQLGIRYMTLTHTNTNDWADSEADLKNPNVKHHDGLNDFGKAVITEMNRLGMMADISHVSDKTMADVLATTKAPIIASHSSARAVANHTRNVNDETLRGIAKNGGVVMVNFYDGFIDPRKAELTLASRAKTEELKALYPPTYPNAAAKVTEELRAWRAAQPKYDKTPLSVLMDHFIHIIKTAGIDHVGIGADLDGVPIDGVPVGMEDVSKYPVITLELLRRGYSDRDVKKLLGENILRVMGECERVARDMQKAQPAPTPARLK